MDANFDKCSRKSYGLSILTVQRQTPCRTANSVLIPLLSLLHRPIYRLEILILLLDYLLISFAGGG